MTRHKCNYSDKRLLAVELDDELLVDRQVDVCASRKSENLTGEIVAVDVQPSDGALTAGDAGLARGLLGILAELALEGEIDTLCLLRLTKLQAVAYDLFDLAGLPVLAWGEVALFNGALVGEALCTLEEEFGPVAAAEAA